MGTLRSPSRPLRTLIASVLLLQAFSVLPGGEEGEAAETAEIPLSMQQAAEEEAAPEFLSLSLGDSEVSLFTTGFWKGSLSGSWGLARSPLGLNAVTGGDPLLFTQEADLTLSLWLRERWFVEANFLDEYNLNTYRAGYQGAPGGTVQYVGIGNNGLDYPAFPYLDLGGDSPSSFGAYGRFGIGPWALHSLVRYDAAAREERVFQGDRERSFAQAPLIQPLRGISFVLPDEFISAVPQVYLVD
jgi:hypothetical protein